MKNALSRLKGVGQKISHLVANHGETISRWLTVLILLVGLISISQSFSARSKLRFVFTGSSGEPIQKEAMLFYRYRFTGVIKNQSTIKNSIIRIHLVVWKDQDMDSTLRFGNVPISITDLADKKEFKLPIVIEGREARDLEIVYEIPVPGTGDEQLLREIREVVPGFYLPKHKYELAFEDINDNLFSQDGKFLNREVIDLNWTLPNTYGDLKHWNPIPFLVHKARIYYSQLRFFARKLFYHFGVDV